MTLIGTLISAGHRVIICCDYEFEESVVRLMNAEEFMNIMIRRVKMAPSEDFVLASEVNTYATTFVKEVFAEYVLDYRYISTSAVPPHPAKTNRIKWFSKN